MSAKGAPSEMGPRPTELGPVWGRRAPWPTTGSAVSRSGMQAVAVSHRGAPSVGGCQGDYNFRVDQRARLFRRLEGHERRWRHGDCVRDFTWISSAWGGMARRRWRLRAAKLALLKRCRLQAGIVLTSSDVVVICMRYVLRRSPKLAPNDKTQVLRETGASRPHPEAVRDDVSWSHPFFDPRDRGQVRYEMARRHGVDARPVTEVGGASRGQRPDVLTRPRPDAGVRCGLQE